MVWQRRNAFTLLEVILATAIGVVLMAALYTAMGIQLRYAKAGREVVEKGNLVRALMARISRDITQNLGPANVTAGASSSAPTAATPNSGSSPTGGSTTGGSQADPSANAAPGASGQASSALSTQITFNLGVQGDSSRLTLFVSRVPREAFLALGSNADLFVPNGTSDLRRITYWLADGGGLARQEVLQVTSDDAMSAMPPNVPNEMSFVEAEEVKNLGFSYFDGSNWQDSWDGTVPGADGQTPVGPPMAIRIQMEIATPESQRVEKYSQVVLIPTANGLGQPPANNSTNNTSGSGP
jgi:prepilin-type N-terminal cleavage/methylation domain-containing protein